ncbi:cupin domain-containing protein [Flavobacterium sp. 2]|uniref:cupin domain-containing protein n=1 Tax=Flavobacterium sp. 2 TaxID=308053 RepID=UPI000C190CB3|nr:cupin domain-containing protein [Flavobacterium sp. 2]PIF70417.1 hypothetical protein CLU99_1152 [Flavobacterium sp. 2]
MEKKDKNTAPQRTESNRIINAPLVEIDLNQSIVQIKNESNWMDKDHNSVTVFKSETMRIVLLGLKKNAELKTHKAGGVISVQVLQGKINFVTEQKSILIEKGQMIALHENILHSVLALEETFFLLTLASNKQIE